jgi:hypothetical protein
MQLRQKAAEEAVAAEGVFSVSLFMVANSEHTLLPRELTQFLLIPAAIASRGEF